MTKYITPFYSIKKPQIILIGFLTFSIIVFYMQINNSGLIPKPSQVATRFVEIITTHDFIDNYLTTIWLTVRAMIYSIIISCLIVYGSLIPILKPVAQFVTKLRYLTLIGLIFIFVLILKSGETVKLSLLMFGIIPFFVTSMVTSLQKISGDEYDLCRTLKFNNWQALLELVIIGRMEMVIETIRSNFAISWMMITTVETLSMADGGIGVMLFRFNKYNQLDKIFALQIVILITGIVCDLLLAKMRHDLFPHVKYNELKTK